MTIWRFTSEYVQDVHVDLDGGSYFAGSICASLGIMSKIEYGGFTVRLKLFPPMIWCVCGDGFAPGATRGSARSTVSCEQPKRSMFCAEADCASNAPAVRVFQNMVWEGSWLAARTTKTVNRFGMPPLFSSFHHDISLVLLYSQPRQCRAKIPTLVTLCRLGFQGVLPRIWPARNLAAYHCCAKQKAGITGGFVICSAGRELLLSAEGGTD